MEAVELEIAEVNHTITTLEAEIREAAGKAEEAENAGNETALQRWVKKEEQLREEKNKLREEKNKLRDKEERLQSAAAAGSSTAGTSWRHPMLATDDTMDQLYKRTSRIYHNDESVGTIARIQTDGLCASATHVFVHDGKFLPCTAFGGVEPLKLVASLPYHDIIFVRGPPGPAFGLQTSELYEPGREVAIVGHPLAPARDLEVEKDRNANPAVAQGRVVMLAPTLELAVADYHAAMPNSSGAPVIFNSTTLAGIHLGTTYHLDDTHYKDVPEAKPERTRVDRNPNEMFRSFKQDVQGKRKAVDPAVVNDLERLALHGVSNIPHKDQMALFVPASYVLNLATDHAGLVATPLRGRPSSRLGGRFETRRSEGHW